MKRFFLLSVLCALCLQVACSEDPPTAPEETNDYTLVETTIIGPAGGSLAIDDFSLTVPTGAFADDHTLELFASSEDQPLGDNQVTRAFRLDGLPAEYSQPLQVSIKYEGSLIEESFIARGEELYDYVHGESAMVYGLHPASAEAGFLTGEVPPRSREARGGNSGSAQTSNIARHEPVGLELLGMSGYRGIYTEHFWIGFPLDLVEVNPLSVEAMLEGVYSSIVSDLNNPWPFPGQINVFVLDLGPSVGAYCPEPDTEYPMLTINRRILSQGNFNTVGVDVGKELLSLILISHDAEAVDPGHYWLWNSVIAWSEKIFTEDAGYQRPATFPGNEMAPFNGIRAGAGDGSDLDLETRHGHGMSAVIEYLVSDSRFGVDGIKGTYETIATGSTPTAALLNNMDALVTTWWPEFFENYVGGEVYGVSSDVFTSHASEWTVDDVNDTLITFSQDYPDLSAKLFRIDLEYSSFDESADLIMTLTGELSTPVSIVAFRIDGTSANYLGQATSQGSASYEISNLQNLISGGLDQLLIVAVNCNVSETYMAQSNLDLQMKIETEPTGTAYNSFDFGFKIEGHWLHIINEVEYEYVDHLIESPWGLVDNIIGEMTDDDTFEGSYESEDVVGEVQATFNTTRDTLLSVSLEMTWEPPGGIYKYHSFDAVNVPRSDELDDWSWFRVDGTVVMDCLDDVQHNYSNPSNNETRDLTGYHCTDEGSHPSYLIIHFHKE